MAEFVTIGELLRLAEEKIPSPYVDFVLGAGGCGQTFARNRRALERLAIEQQVLLGFDEVDITTEFLGLTLASPAIVCPMGSLFKLHPDGDLEMTRGVGRAGSLWAVPKMAAWTLEEIAAAATGPLLYQTYCDTHLERERQREEIGRVEACPQYKGVAVTVDGGSKNRLDRYVETRAVDDRSRYPGPRSLGHRFDWDDFGHLREDIHIPMGIKGILGAKDAVAAIEHGADFVWISNHGGRHLDSARATIDVLEEIAEAVSGRVPLIVDSGFQHGSDIAKARARGALLVGFGKVAACALGVDGAEGVAGLLEIVNEELRIALALSGRSHLRELDRDSLRRVEY